MAVHRKPSFRSYVNILPDDQNKEKESDVSDGSRISECSEASSDSFVDLSTQKHGGNHDNPNDTDSCTSHSRMYDVQSHASHVDVEGDRMGDTVETCSGVHPEQVVTNKGDDVKLCGYLYKKRVGSKLNQYKRRWFVYSDSSCRLVYYKNADDIKNLGEIELACASITFDVENERRSNLFKLSSNGIEYIMQAPDRHTMVYWCQQIQQKRRNFSERKASLTGAQKLGSKSNQQPSKGLLKATLSNPESPELPAPEPNVLEEVEAPEGTVGVNSSHTQHSNPWQRLNDISLVNLKTEVANYAYRRKHSGQNANPVVSPTERTPSTSQSEPSLLLRQNHQRSNTLNNLFHRPRITRSMLGAGTKEHAIFPPYRCSHCKQLQETLRHEREQTEALEEELAATKMVVETLQNHISGFVKNLGQSMSDEPPESSRARTVHKLLYDELQAQIEQSKIANASAQDQINCLQSEMVDLQDQITMYKDSIQAKDSVVMALTDRVSELERALGAEGPEGDSGRQSSASNVTVFSADLSQVEHLKDTCEAYRMQNRILSQEILDLNRLRERDELQERAHKVNYAKLEAEYYCTKSKYLVCLNELNKPKIDGHLSDCSVNQDTIQELLQDAMDSGAKPVPDRPEIQEHEKYDKYGFWFIPPEAAEDVETRADSLQQKSDQLSAKANALDKEFSVQVKWDNFLISQGERPLERTQELKQLIRAGIPIEHRERIWNFCIKCHLGNDKANYGPNYYQKLLQRAALSNSLNPAVTQVELDLLRTLPNNCHYESSSSEGIPKLRNVLLAFSLHNEDIGYCQGLNRLAAIALLFLEEEDAFWCLVVIVEYLLPKGYYSKGLVAAHIDQRVLKDLLLEKAPKITQLLQLHNIDLAMFTFNWFLTLFVDNAPVETYLRIWDSFLFEGSKVMFRFAVAFFKYCEDDLLQSSGSLELHNQLRTLCEHITDVNRVTDIAFSSVNPFPMKTIAGRRNYHMQIVNEEIEVLRRKRASLQETSSQSLSKESECASPSPEVQAPAGRKAGHCRSLNSDEEIDEV